MGEVFEFPSKNRSFEAIQESLVATLRKVGIPEDVALETIEEYRSIHSRLFDPAESTIRLPEEAAISDKQAALIIPVIRDFHLERMGVAAMAIVGLLARQKLDAIDRDL